MRPARVAAGLLRLVLVGALLGCVRVLLPVGVLLVRVLPVRVMLLVRPRLGGIPARLRR
ncbi:hypothetical protein Sfulv_34900 [Streptomyces fulvorobeus]|uniref:Uncharacterized protein n=1 Tax=Streptomyces fulvorobeus TaxID=284028 RepID=A0A7J0C886_9ACTN|nr:hypothetical protein Sfulv_34900 [Streptomyces fulvorobeus]